MKTYGKSAANLLIKLLSLRAGGPPSRLKTKLLPRRERALPANSLTNLPVPPQSEPGKHMQNERMTRADTALREMAEEAEPGHCHTLNEIADVMGITRERVRQIEMKAKRNFRNRLSLLLKSEGVRPDEISAVLSAARIH